MFGDGQRPGGAGRRLGRLGLVFGSLGLAAAVMLPSCAKAGGNAEKGRGGPRTVPVSVATVAAKSVPVELNTFGTVRPAATVEIRAEVGGILVKAHVRKGQDVRNRQPLFDIDPRSYQADLTKAQADQKKAEADQKKAEADLAKAQADLAKAQADLAKAQADLARDTALAHNAQANLAREKALFDGKISSQSDYDKALADSDSLAATVRGDEAAATACKAAIAASQATVSGCEAAVSGCRAAIAGCEATTEAAQIQVDRCTIRSPIDGRAGDLLVNEGNLVKANDVPLIVLLQVQPIEVWFSVPQADLAAVRKHLAAGKLVVQAVLPRQEGGPEVGELTFIDSAVDKSTGTILLAGTFQNRDQRLWPGQHVKVKLTLTTLKDAVVAPAAAVQTGRDGKYVFLVKRDLTVELRPVTIGQVAGDGVVIEKGEKGETALLPGDRVVTDGQLALVNGSKVEIKPDVRKEASPPATGAGSQSGDNRPAAASAPAPTKPTGATTRSGPAPAKAGTAVAEGTAS